MVRFAYFLAVFLAISLCCVITDGAPAQDKSNEQILKELAELRTEVKALKAEIARLKGEKLSPSEAVRAWNDALFKGDVKTAAELTSKTSKKDLEELFRSLEALSAIYQKDLKGLKLETKSVHEEVSGDSAVVVYRVQYGADKIKYWMDKLFREDGVWKVAPQYVQMLPLKE